MQVLKSTFFHPSMNIGSSSSNIYLMPKKFTFNIHGDMFEYSFTKNRFVGYVKNKNFFVVSDMLRNNGIDYTASLINKRFSFYNGKYKFIIKNDVDNDYMKFIDIIKNNKLKFEILYESEDWAKDIPYSRNFFINNIKKTIDPNGFYCTIDISSKSIFEGEEHINIFLSGNFITINGIINYDRELIGKIKNITVPSVVRNIEAGKYFNVSNDPNIPLDYNKINNFLNSVLDYFQELYIKYIYVGYNYHN